MSNRKGVMGTRSLRQVQRRKNFPGRKLHNFLFPDRGQCHSRDRLKEISHHLILVAGENYYKLSPPNTLWNPMEIKIKRKTFPNMVDDE
jgi:hypothetical protein